MAKKREAAMYQRVFFDRTLLVGLLFLAMAYIVQGTWVGAFCEAVAFVVGIIWSYRAMTTNKHVVVRLATLLILVLIGSLLAFYIGRVHGLL